MTKKSSSGESGHKPGATKQGKQQEAKQKEGKQQEGTAKPSAAKPTGSKPTGSKQRATKPDASPSRESDSSESKPSAAKPSDTQTSVETPPASKPTRVSSWMLLVVSALIGITIAVATFSINRISGQPPQAEATLILDETQNHWPFYKSSHEEARFIVEDPDLLQAAAALMQEPEQATSIEIQTSSELSIFGIIATAESDEGALELATASARELEARSEARRHEPILKLIGELGTEIDGLEAEQARLAADVDAGSSDADSIINRSELAQVSDRLNDQRDALRDAQSTLDATSSAYQFLGPAVVDQPATQSLVASLAAGAGAAVLTLLMFSFFSAPSSEARDQLAS